MKKSFKKILTVGLCAAMMFSLAGCGNDDAEENKEQQTADAFPFTLTTYDDSEVTFTKVPERIISTNINTGEQLMAMGLGDKIIGTSSNVYEMAPEYAEEYASKPVLAGEMLPLEKVLEVQPDFVYGRAEVFKDKRTASHDTLTSYGIPSLSSYESYKLGCKIEDVYQDFYNLGRIFQKQDRAEEIVSGMKKDIAAIQDKVKGEEAPTVIVFDSASDNGCYVAGNNFTSELIRLAGGHNPFEDLPKQWNEISWEKVIEADPDVIICNVYSGMTAESQVDTIKSNPALQNIKAVKNDRFITISLAEAFASSRCGETVEKFAAGFFPELFK